MASMALHDMGPCKILPDLLLVHRVMALNGLQFQVSGIMVWSVRLWALGLGARGCRI